MTGSRRILVAGASGLIGTAFVHHVEAAGHEAKRLVRREPQSLDEYEWDPYAEKIDGRALKGVDTVVCFSGASIGDGRWTGSRKQVLYGSRVTPTSFLAKSIATADEPPAVFVSQSAIGIYGDRGNEILTESSEEGPQDDFLVSLTRSWEEATLPAEVAGVRVVKPRTGLVLDRKAQLVDRLLPLFQSGIGGKLGNGAQWWSWISLQDTVRAIEHLAVSSLSGPVNLVSPRPVRQRDFTRALAKAIGRPALFRVPPFGLRFALGAEKANAVGLSSTRVLPAALESSDFTFLDTDLEATLREVITSRPSE